MRLSRIFIGRVVDSGTPTSDFVESILVEGAGSVALTDQYVGNIDYDESVSITATGSLSVSDAYTLHHVDSIGVTGSASVALTDTYTLHHVDSIDVTATGGVAFSSVYTLHHVDSAGVSGVGSVTTSDAYTLHHEDVIAVACTASAGVTESYAVGFDYFDAIAAAGSASVAVTDTYDAPLAFSESIGVSAIGAADITESMAYSDVAAVVASGSIVLTDEYIVPAHHSDSIAVAATGSVSSTDVYAGAVTMQDLQDQITALTSLVAEQSASLLEILNVSDLVDLIKAQTDRLTFNISDEIVTNIDAATIAAAVWDKTAIDHNAVGSMGEKQNTVQADVDTNAIASAIELQLTDNFASITVDNTAIAVAVDSHLATRFTLLGNKVDDTPTLTASALSSRLDFLGNEINSVAADVQSQLNDDFAAIQASIASIDFSVVEGIVWNADLTNYIVAGSAGKKLADGTTGAVSVDYGLIATSVHSELSGDLGILDGKLNTIVTATTSTIPTAISSLHNFNPATDVVARVALVDVTTLNSDMRGTDGANTTVPPTVTEIVTGMYSTSTQLTALVNASGSIATQISNLHDFDPANDDVARVLNVTTNDDMRGTDNVDVTNLNIALGHITDLYKAHYRRRYYNSVNNTITIYAADGTTPEFIFDANADMSDIGPNNFTPD
jgi:hypothetical protein